MSSAPIPANERERLHALRELDILDSPPEPAFDRIASLARRMLGTSVGLITLVDAERLWFKSLGGLSLREMPREGTFCAHAIADPSGVFVVADTTRDERFADQAVVVEGGMRFYAGAPIVNSGGHCIGTVCVMDRRKRPALSLEEEETLRDLAQLAMAEIEARRSFGSVDAVTRLANVSRLRQDLREAIVDRSEPVLSLGIIEYGGGGRYDELATILGYPYADDAVRIAAEAARAVAPRDSTVYGLGGFRFAFVSREVGTMDLSVDGTGRQSPESVGLATFPADAATAEELIHAALSAASDARESGTVVRGYDYARDEARRRRLRLAGDLRRLEGMPQLTLDFQPKIDLATGECVGAEALVRWRHPDLGLISPAEFIPLAEQTGAMHSITDWVLESAISRAAVWFEAGFRVPIAVNVSMLDLRYKNFAYRLGDLLSAHGVAPEAIEVEVTETALSGAIDMASEQLRILRARGMDVAIDDFGTGNSAHAYLKLIPANVLKIDQSFVTALHVDESDRVIVASIIELGHRLGHRIVAEGIESHYVLSWLRHQGCDLGQGYAIARPMAAADFERWLVSGPYPVHR